MLEVKDVHKVYDSSKKSIHVLKGINIEIDKGTVAAIVGPSGAGKSTLLHIVGGLDTPTKGTVVFAGQDYASISDAERCRIRNDKIGFVFQFYHLLSEFTVLENVLMPALIKAQGRTGEKLRAQERAKGLLEEVGLKERMQHFPSELSGGEQQRAAIVRALINRPALLLCDEPTGNLDSATGNEIIRLIMKINSQEKMTVVLVTHNLEIARMAQKRYQLRDGVLSAIGNVG